MGQEPPLIHPSAEVAPGAQVGPGTRVWHQAQIREGARVGRECILGKGVYVDADVTVGDRVKIENGACLYRGASVAHGVFIGPHALLLNDQHPRAITPEGALKQEGDWELKGVTVEEGASIGAGAILLPGIRVGRFAMVGAGATVTVDVPAHGLVVGNPAALRGFVCACGAVLREKTPLQPLAESAPPGGVRLRCPRCGRLTEVERTLWEAVCPP